MRYFLYARKSTDDEDRQILSIEAQVTETKEYAIKENLQIVQEFIESKSAKVPGRPIFNEMMSLLQKGKADAILAWHPDRLARNSLDGGKIIYLVDKGVIKDLRFPTYRFDNTAQGKFMLSIAFGQSKYYVDNLSENIKRGIRQKVRNGVYPSLAPVGYLNDPKSRNIVIDRVKAPLVRKIFELYTTGDYTLDRLKDTITSLGFRTTNDKMIGVSKLRLILTNPFYYGMFKYWNELFEATHEPIITKKLFEKCQSVLKKRGKPRQSKRTFVFRGLMKCGECGRMITAEIHKEFTYYRCTKRNTICSQKYIREEDLAKQIRGIFQKVSLCDDWTAKIIKELEKDKARDVQSSRPHQQNLERDIGNIDTKINKLVDIYLEESIAKEEYAKKKSELLNKKKDLQERLRDFADGDNNWFEQARSFVTLLNRASYVSRGGNLESQKEFLEKIGSNFILKERRLIFSAEGTFRPYLSRAPFSTWWSRGDSNP
ncbi:MAG: recombinase family protein [Candidatus Omnitrophica bacterium]|nr:recombinase family protein [Candidatus Omnitrophota bacterium]